MSLTEVLVEITRLPEHEAIAELAAFKTAAGKSGFNTAVKSLPRHLKPKLKDLNDSEINRRKLLSYEGFTVGDRVRVKSSEVPQQLTKRGRLRSNRSRRRVMSARKGQTREPIGFATNCGSRKVFYLDRRSIVNSTYQACSYPSLVGVELTIFEFDPPLVTCLRSSGTPAPALLATELEKNF